MLEPDNYNPTGRFPAQTFVDDEASAVIDLQSGVQKSNPQRSKQVGNSTFYGGAKMQRPDSFLNDIGGASRILYKCNFEAGDYDLYHYCAKVSKSERNEGLDEFEKIRIQGRNEGQDTRDVPYKKRITPMDNHHPTLKPKALLSKILKLFKTPNNQVLLDPFMGSGSMGISAVETGFDYIGYELDQDYFKIAEARIKYAQDKKESSLGLFGNPK